MLEPTCRALCYSDAGCLSSIRTYLPGTVLQGCRLFKQCWSLPAWHCVAGVRTVSAMTEPTCRALCYSGESCFSNDGPTCRALCYSDAGCLSIVGTYLQGTVLQGCRLFKHCGNLPTGQGCRLFRNASTYLPGTVLQWCRLLKRCQNLPTGHCVTVMQAV